MAEIAPGYRTLLSRQYDVLKVVNQPELMQAALKLETVIFCFDYDYPDLSSLKLLQDTKREYPSFPILMFTQHHSEALAVWALRVRVWDYMVKPILSEELVKRIEMLSIAMGEGCGQRCTFSPPSSIPHEMRFRHAAHPHHITQPAIGYVETHYHDTIRLTYAARLCRLGNDQFSRLFKKHQNMTFRDFVMQYRMQKAKELLNLPSPNVTDVALGTGFNDVSFFCAAFKRHTGFTPLQFRKAQGKCALPTAIRITS